MSADWFTVVVCGGRDFNSREVVFRTLDDVDKWQGPIRRIVNGSAAGADSLSSEWAEQRGRGLTLCPAKWRTEGLAAGPLRNQRMLDEHKPDLVVAFPGGRGTADMVRRAKAVGVEVIEVPR